MASAVTKVHAKSEDICFSRGRVWCKSISKTVDMKKEVTKLEL